MMKCLILTLLCLLGACFGGPQNESKKFKGNILCIMPCASPSHHIWNRVLMEALANAGYNVTALSTDVDEKTVPNLHYIHMEGVYDVIYGKENFDLIEYATANAFQSIQSLMHFFAINAKGALQSKGTQTLLNYPDDFKFDLVVYDYSIVPGLLGFIHKFNYPPVVGVSAFMNPPNTREITGNPLFPSLLPYYVTSFPVNMNFWQRSVNLFYYIVDSVLRSRASKLCQGEAEKVFGKDLPDIRDLEKKIDVTLVNIHPAVDIPEPLLPNVIPVGGLQVKESKALPEDIKKFVESSKKGSVLFSLGSNMKSALLGEKRIQMFLRAFAKFPEYHFLWKFEGDGLEIPKNVMVQKWVPQNDLLAHPKVILFMTHCGLLSTHETTWHGVPMLGIPLFCDQHTNLKKAMDAGVAEKLDIFTTTEAEVVSTLKQMLEDPSYQKAMDLRSSRFRDRVVPPLQEAVWWCEYVLRHKGAPHLRSAAADMNPLVLFMWDLLIIWGIVFISTVVITALVLKKLFCRKQIRASTNGYLQAKKAN